MAAAAKVYVETYTRPDGSLIWHEQETPWVDAHGRPRYDHAGNPMPWPGMDGSAVVCIASFVWRRYGTCFAIAPATVPPPSTWRVSAVEHHL